MTDENDILNIAIMDAIKVYGIIKLKNNAQLETLKLKINFGQDSTYINDFEFTGTFHDLKKSMTESNTLVFITPYNTLISRELFFNVCKVAKLLNYCDIEDDYSDIDIFECTKEGKPQECYPVLFRFGELCFLIAPIKPKDESESDVIW